MAIVREQAAAPGHRLPLQVVMPMASTPDCEVEVSGGSAGLESQGPGRAPHPVMGGAVRPSCRAGFGRCCVVPVVTSCRSCLRRGVQGWRLPPRWLSFQSWRSEWSVPVSVRAGAVDGVRPLFIPSQGSR
jgi:hypothetical protein